MIASTFEELKPILERALFRKGINTEKDYNILEPLVNFGSPEKWIAVISKRTGETRFFHLNQLLEL